MYWTRTFYLQKFLVDSDIHIILTPVQDLLIAKQEVTGTNKYRYSSSKRVNVISVVMSSVGFI